MDTERDRSREETVSLVACDGYGRETVGGSVARAIELLGGAGSFVEPGRSVYVKPNAVFAADPDSGIVTNPEVVRAVVREFQKVTDDVTVGDSPGGPYNQAMLKRVYERTGLADVALETGARLDLDTRAVDISFPQGGVVKRLTLCHSMAEADCLVSVPKFKSHRFMNVSGPIKNLYGVVPGTTKLVYHSRFDGELGFADLVVDVCLAAGADLHVLDAVDVIEGDGARKGAVKRMGVLAASSDAFALESLIMELAGLAPSDSKPLEAAIRRDLCPRGTEWFEVLGECVDSLRSSGFRLPSENLFSERALAMLSGRLSRLIAASPQPLPGACTLCGRCAEICPRGAITMGRKAARVNLRKCIRCFCCEELCEHQAIEVRRPLLARLKSGGQA